MDNYGLLMCNAYIYIHINLIKFTLYNYIYSAHINMAMYIYIYIRILCVCALHFSTLHCPWCVAAELVAEAGYDPDGWKSQLYPNEIARDAQHGQGSDGH